MIVRGERNFFPAHADSRGCNDLCDNEPQSSMSLRLTQEHEKCVRHDAFWPFVLCRAGLLRRLRFRLVACVFSEQNIEQ
jgi:hypothetical protein